MRTRLLEQFQSFRIELWKKVSRSREVRLGPCKVRDETICNSVADDCYDDRNCGGCLLGYDRGWGSVNNENIDICCNKLRYELWEPIVLPFRPAKLNINVRPLNVAK